MTVTVFLCRNNTIAVMPEVFCPASTIQRSIKYITTETTELPLGLYWKGKRTTVDRTVLPFQNLEVIETVNESLTTASARK